MDIGQQIIASIALALMMLTGCGGKKQPPPVTIDEHFATPDALLQEFNAFNTRLPRDLRQLLPLYHLENDFQRKKWELLKRQSESADYDLDVAFRARFGEGLINSKRLKLKACTPAVLTKFQELRVEGSYNDWRGKQRPLHLIKMDGRWWVSGYTLEYETDTEMHDLIESVTDSMLDLEYDDGFLRPLIVRVRNGDFATAEEARKEYFSVVLKEFKKMKSAPDQED